MTSRPSRRRAIRSRTTDRDPVVHVGDAARPKITNQEVTALREWVDVRRMRSPRWLARMQEAMRLVASAAEAHGRQRHNLLVDAAKIVAALREPRTYERVAFRRSLWLIEVAIGKLGGCVGCLAAGVSLADEQLYAGVKRVVNAADPIGLRRAGAPEDEYHPEIDEIACWLPEPRFRTVAQTHAIVHGVFVKWFGARVAGPRVNYRKIATAIHALRRSRSARKESMKNKPSPSTTRLDVQVPVDLYDRLIYMSRLPAHESWGGTLEALVVRALEEGSVGIAVAYERFEEKKPVTDELRQQAFGKPKAKTRRAAGSKGRRLVHRQ